MDEALTVVAYTRLQQAYDTMNQKLFGGELPQCLMTWQRSRNFAGFFAPHVFTRLSKEQKAHEIALNPDCFDDEMDVMQTLVHEMVHLWQHEYGQTCRQTYHNKEWANKMEAVGLMPSDTGKPGGKRTGQQMADYPIPGGLFEREAKAFLADGPMVDWHSARYRPPDPAMPLVNGEDEGQEAVVGEPAPTSRRKTKYTCPGCGINVWGKPGLNVICGTDKQQLLANE